MLFIKVIFLRQKYIARYIHLRRYWYRSRELPHAVDAARKEKEKNKTKTKNQCK